VINPAPVNWRHVMDWETPSFDEIRMDAELTAYQDDLGDAPRQEAEPAEPLPADA
jgi:coenzyme PQQ precursor peptide PqqA